MFVKRVVWEFCRESERNSYLRTRLFSSEEEDFSAVAGFLESFISGMVGNHRITYELRFKEDLSRARISCQCLDESWNMDNIHEEPVLYSDSYLSELLQNGADAEEIAVRLKWNGDAKELLIDMNGAGKRI